MIEQRMSVKVSSVFKEEETREENENLANLIRLNNNNTRRSLRSMRAKSVVITERERSLLLKQEGKASPQPSKGFVKSMCRFYSDIIGGDRRKFSNLDRSASFSGPKEKKAATLDSLPETTSSPLSCRADSLRQLARSRSWRERRSSEQSESPKRSSPTGQSVRSQDSGFSDSGENLPADLVISSSFDLSPREMPFVTKIEVEGESSGLLRPIGGGEALPRDPRVGVLSPPEAATLSTFSSSTPVRASFRRNRPQTMICLEDGKLQPTPVKRESRTRLKEIKSRRRWSSVEHTSSHHLRDLEGASPSLRSRPVEEDCCESVCVDSTGTRLMADTFLEDKSCLSTATAVTATAGGVSSTIFPPPAAAVSLVLGGVGGASETIIEHEASGGCSRLSEAASLNSSRRGQADPVMRWWVELFMSTEPECMTYLQSKPILRSQQGTKHTSAPVAFYPYEMIKTTLATKRAVLVTLSLLKSHFSALNLLQMNKTIGVLVKQIKDFIYEHSLRSHSDPQEEATRTCQDLPGFRASWRRPQEAKKETKEAAGLGELVSLQERSVLQVVDRLRLCAHRCQYTATQPLLEMRRTVRQLEDCFSKFVELVLGREVRTVVGILERQQEEDEAVVHAVNTVIRLGNEQCGLVYTVIAKEGGVRALLDLVRGGPGGRGPRGREVQLLSLRGLSSICCTVEAVRELEAADGLEVVSTVLTSASTSHPVRVEAAGVLAQVTSPWISENHSIRGLKEQVRGLVEHLTRLARLRADDDTFLLVSAALANLTFMEPSAVEEMEVRGTASVLMTAVQASPFTSLFAKDQVTTVLANLAARETCRASILAEDGLSFLLSLLSTSPGNTPSQAEGGAAERVLKKAAIALSRLCCLPSVCEDLISLGGLSPLVRLCKEAASRNYNDSVLVACLAVLRRVGQHCGHHVLDDLEARDLIDPRLMDSFLEYSSKQESYV